MTILLGLAMTVERTDPLSGLSPVNSKNENGFPYFSMRYVCGAPPTDPFIEPVKPPMDPLNGPDFYAYLARSGF